MFGQTFESAMKSINSSIITLWKDEKERQIYEFKSPNDTYYVYPNIYFCSCPAFRIQVLTMQMTRLCKHVIATRIATAFGDVKEGFMNATAMSEIYRNMSHCTIGTPARASAAAVKTEVKREAGDTDTSGELQANDTSTE